MWGDLRVGIEIKRRLPHAPPSVAEARRALEPLERRLDPDTFETLRLLVSELVTNSVRHGQAEESDELELAVRASRETIRVEVADGGLGFEASPRAEGQDKGSGWGLHLLETLSDRWGTEQNGRMRVWFELVDSGAFVVRRAS
jgi:anti-sigma regulatory factor (Ser/Thr protein kinase)